MRICTFVQNQGSIWFEIKNSEIYLFILLVAIAEIDFIFIVINPRQYGSLTT